MIALQIAGQRQQQVLRSGTSTLTWHWWDNHVKLLAHVTQQSDRGSLLVGNA